MSLSVLSCPAEASVRGTAVGSRRSAVAEKLRASVETCNFHFRETIVPITISCGIAEFSANDTPENVFERADTAMYRAKKVGGNRCLMEEEAAHK